MGLLDSLFGSDGGSTDSDDSDDSSYDGSSRNISSLNAQANRQSATGQWGKNPDPRNH